MPFSVAARPHYASPAAPPAASPLIYPGPSSGAVSPRARFHALISDVGVETGLRQALLCTPLPGGGLVACQHVDLEPSSRKSIDVPVRAQLEQLVWQVLLGAAPTGTDFALTASGWTAGRVPAPVFEGYPGVLLLAGTPGTGYSPEALIRQISAVWAETLELPAEKPSLPRQFYLDADGNSVVPADQPMADAISLSLSRQGRASGEGEQRTLLPWHDGTSVPATITPTPVASPLAGWGVARIVSVYPSPRDWRNLTPAHFAADHETARLAAAAQFMAGSFQRGVSLQEVAASVELSAFHFHRRFTQCFGITPKQLLFELQLDHARSLLGDRSLSMADVARACGFAHQSHFTSRFRQGTGQTPSAWRRHVLRSD